MNEVARDLAWNHYLRDNTMATKSRSPAPKCRSQPDPYFPDLDPLADLLRTPPATTEDRLRHIRVLGQRIAAYVRFMSAAARRENSSVEERQRAVTVFYERLLLMEQELARVYENFRLT